MKCIYTWTKYIEMGTSWHFFMSKWWIKTKKSGEATHHKKKNWRKYLFSIFAFLLFGCAKCQIRDFVYFRKIFYCPCISLHTHTHTYTTYTVLSVRFFTGKPKHLLQLHSILFLLVMNFSNELISTLEKNLKGIRNLSQYSACVNNQFSFYQFSSRVKVSVCEATEPGEEYAFMTEYTRYQQITAHEGLCI